MSRPLVLASTSRYRHELLARLDLEFIAAAPDFDERDYGFSSFSRLLEAMEKEGLLTRIQQGRQTYVTSKDGAPEPRADDPEVRDAAPRSEESPEPPPRAPIARVEEESIPDPDEEG